MQPDQSCLELYSVQGHPEWGPYPNPVTLASCPRVQQHHPLFCMTLVSPQISLLMPFPMVSCWTSLSAQAEDAIFHLGPGLPPASSRNKKNGGASLLRSCSAMGTERWVQGSTPCQLQEQLQAGMHRHV